MDLFAPVLAILLGFVYMLVPGWMVVRAFGVRRYTYLLSTSVSLAILTCTQLPFRFDGGSFPAWVVTFHTSVVILIGVGMFIRKGSRSSSNWRYIRSRMSTSWYDLRAGRAGLYAGFAACLLVYVTYYLVVGPYTEVPADFWTHLVSVKWEYYPLLKGEILQYGSTPTVLVDREYVHFLHGAVAYLTGLPHYQSVAYSMLVASTLFLGGIYWLSVAVFAGQRWTIARRTFVAIVTVGLTLVWFGVSVFSFVRYYSLAPAILNFIVLFTAVVLHLDYLRRPSAGIRQLAAVALLVVVMGIVHRQEALFTVVLIGLISLYAATYRALGRSHRAGNRGLNRRAYAVGLAAVVLGTSGAVLIKVNMEMNDPVPPYVVDIGRVIPFLKNMDVLNPWVQFYDVLAPFGVIAYLYFIINWRRFKNNAFIMAGMLSPLFTVFNPVFVSVFLNLSPYQTLWRLTLLIPIAFLGAVMVSDLYEKVIDAKVGIREKAAAILGVTVLCVSLLPLNTKYYENTKSRLGTLAEIRPDGGMEWLSDGIGYVNGLDRRRIITDPVSSYVFRAASKHSVKGWKFYEGRSGYNLRELVEKGGLDALYEHTGMLLIVNNRDGSVSRNGQLSGHWPADVLKVTEWYPERFTEKIDSSGSGFELLWKRQGLSIYEIRG